MAFTLGQYVDYQLCPSESLQDQWLASCERQGEEARVGCDQDDLIELGHFIPVLQL